MKNITNAARFLFLLICLTISVNPLRAATNSLPYIKTVFIIMMENELWEDVYFTPNAPYMSQTLIPQSSYCENYMNVPHMHPSEPNYLWLEAGTNFGIYDSNTPDINHQNTTNHLTWQLNNAGISWKTYQEDIDGSIVPLYYTNLYAPRHNPFIYFDDVTGTNDPSNAYGIAHNRPYTEFAGDLASNNVARYNFITPNLINDGHNVGAPLYNQVLQADTWLSQQIPIITNSAAYQNNGAIFILWDEGSNGRDGQIPMILLSPVAKGGGYFSIDNYNHSSTLRTMQEIFGVGPFLGDAANAEDLSDLFIPAKNGGGGPPPGLTSLPQGLMINNFAQNTDGSVGFNVSGCTSGKAHVVQISTDLQNWSDLSTNMVSGTTFNFNDPSTAGNTNSQCFYRVIVRQ